MIIVCKEVLCIQKLKYCPALCFHSFLFLSLFLYSFASSQTGQYSSATYGDRSNLLAPVRSHAKVCMQTNCLPLCVLCIFYSLRTRTTLTYLCFSSSWLLWHAHHMFLSVLCRLSFLLGKYVNILHEQLQLYTLLYSPLFCRVGGSTLQVVNLLVRERWVTHWSATF